MNDFAMTKTSGKLDIIRIELKKMKSLHSQMEEFMSYNDGKYDEGLAEVLMDMSIAMQDSAKAVDLAASEIWHLAYRSKPAVIPASLAGKAEAVQEVPTNEPV